METFGLEVALTYQNLKIFNHDLSLLLLNDIKFFSELIIKRTRKYLFNKFKTYLLVEYIANFELVKSSLYCHIKLIRIRLTMGNHYVCHNKLSHHLPSYLNRITFCVRLLCTICRSKAVNSLNNFDRLVQKKNDKINEKKNYIRI